VAEVVEVTLVHDHKYVLGETSIQVPNVVVRIVMFVVHV
jgi:hypothetical protein